MRTGGDTEPKWHRIAARAFTGYSQAGAHAPADHFGQHQMAGKICLPIAVKRGV